MFGYRTPINKNKMSQKEEDGTKVNVRRLTEEFEPSTSRNTPEPQNQTAAHSITTDLSNTLERAEKFKQKVVYQLNTTRNTKTEIKQEILKNVKELYQMVLTLENKNNALSKEILQLRPLKNLKASNRQEKGNDKEEKGKEEGKETEYIIEIKKALEENTKTIKKMLDEQRKEKENYLDTKTTNIHNKEEKGKQLIEIQKSIEENTKITKENSKKLEEINSKIQENEKQKVRTYASVVATPDGDQPRRTALHSIVVTSVDEMDTGEEVLETIRKTVRAKEEGLNIESIRKARDRKIIIGCKTEEGRKTIKEKLRKAENKLKVEDAINKKPLVVFKNVRNSNTDTEIKSALKLQNQHIFEDLSEQDGTMEILFRKKTRNPQVSHVVARVTPLLWSRMTNDGHLYIDLQRIRVEDQSPLIQCSMCLGYGHSKRLCTEKTPRCSHCGGSHVKAKCGEWLANTTPACCNCSHAKLEKINHNAFSNECPIRQKWEKMARATIDYI